jgi:hypothetical protein
MIALSPGHSHVFNVTCIKEGGPGMRPHVHGVIIVKPREQKGRFMKLPIFSYRI